MRNHNKKPSLKSNSIYFQIGLIVALAIALFFIEKTTQKVMAEKESYNQKVFKLEEAYSLPIVLEKTKPETNPEKKQKSKKLPTLPNEEPVKNTKSMFQPSANKPDVGKVDLKDPIDEPLPDFPDANKPVSMTSLSEAPIFPGCEIYETKEERVSCFSEKIKKLVGRKFNSDLGLKMGLTGTQRIYVNFTINKEGEIVNIQARSSHKELADEAKRVTSLLPLMTPGKRNGNIVNVNYSLPILLDIQ